MNESYTITLERAQSAAKAMLGVGPDPRDAGMWNTYLVVDAKAFAQLLDALNVPRNVTTVSTTGATLFDEAST